MPGVTEGPLAFELQEAAERTTRWLVSCDGVECALLQSCEIDSQWDLNGIGSLDGRCISWRHNGARFRNPPAWVRRRAVDTLAAWALDELAVREAA